MARGDCLLRSLTRDYDPRSIEITRDGEEMYLDHHFETRDVHRYSVSFAVCRQEQRLPAHPCKALRWIVLHNAWTICV